MRHLNHINRMTIKELITFQTLKNPTISGMIKNINFLIWGKSIRLKFTPKNKLGRPQLRKLQIQLRVKRNISPKVPVEDHQWRKSNMNYRMMIQVANYLYSKLEMNHVRKVCTNNNRRTPNIFSFNMNLCWTSWMHKCKNSWRAIKILNRRICLKI